MNPEPVSFTTYNARFLSAAEVVRTFVPNDEGIRLQKNEHSLLLGPRGSGKTTLFKMLTTEAQYYWKKKYSSERPLPFCAIYIPTDVQWNQQLISVGQSGIIENDIDERLSRAICTTNILYAVCTTIEARLAYEIPSRKVKLSHETALCKTMIKEWDLIESLPRLSEVRLSLLSRVNDLNNLTQQMQSNNSRVGIKLPKYCYMEYLSATRVVCQRFMDLYHPSITKWALCFDELELAPQWLATELYQRLRSTDQLFYFKLSTSPTPEIHGVTHSIGQDYSAIYLWPTKDSHSDQFCKKLIENILLEKRIGSSDGSSLIDLLGSSVTDEIDTGREYLPGGAAVELISDVASWDKSLADLLTRHGIDPLKPYAVDQHKRDTVLRRLKPIVAHRAEFLKHASVPKGRSRKRHTMYAGLSAIQSVCEGNPRRIIDITNRLLPHIKHTKSGSKIPPKQQARAIQAVSEQMLARLRVLPLEPAVIGSRRVTLSDLIDRIGDGIYARQIREKCTLDPVGSFKIDRKVPSDVIVLLRRALYEGAIIHLDPESWAPSPVLINKRYRLSFILSPNYRLSLRLYEACDLTSLIGGRVKNSDSTPSLFGADQ